MLDNNLTPATKIGGAEDLLRGQLTAGTSTPS
jgi:hypothetical protein